MTLARLAFRYQRTGLIVMSLLGSINVALNAAAFEQLAGNTPEQRAIFGQQMELLGRQMSYMLPDPVQLDTMGGYLTWRNFGPLSLVFAVWAILAATGAGRGEEERGLTEHWLATGLSRTRWLIARTSGFVAAAVLAIGATLASTALTAAAVDDALPLGGVALEGVALLALTLMAFGIGLAIAQLVITRRVAASIGAAVIVGLYLLNSASRSGLDLGWIASISPFALFDRSRPLLPRGGGIDVAATSALYIAAAALVALSLAAFIRRDVGSVLLRLRQERMPATARPSADPLLRVPVLAMVGQQRWWLMGWTVALALLAYFLTSVGRAIVDGMMAIPSLRVYFERLGVSAFSDLIGVLWFGTSLFILSGLAIAQVNGWAADDGEGRLEAMLAAGASRPRVILERIAALLVVTGVVATVSSIVVFYGARALDIAIPADRLVVATADTLPVVFAFGGIGAALVGWRPRVATVLLGAVAVVSYVVLQFQALFGWPEWVGRISIYQLYGMPLTRDDWGGIATLVAIGVAATAIALVAMRRRDVGV